MKISHAFYGGLYPKSLVVVLLPIALGLLFTYIKTNEILKDIQEERNEIFSRETDKFKSYLNLRQALPYIKLVRMKNELSDGIPVYIQQNNNPFFIGHKPELAALSMTSSSINCGGEFGPRFTGQIELSATNTQLQISGSFIDKWNSPDESESAQPSHGDRLGIEMLFDGYKSVKIEYLLGWWGDLHQEKKTFSNEFQDEDAFQTEGTWKKIQNSNRITFQMALTYKHALALSSIKLSFPGLSESFLHKEKCTFDSGWKKIVYYSPEIEGELSRLLPTKGGVFIGGTTRIDPVALLNLTWSRPDEALISSYVFEDIERGPPSFFESIGRFVSEIEFSVPFYFKQPRTPDDSTSSRCPTFGGLPYLIQRVISQPNTLLNCISIESESFADLASVVLWSKQSQIEQNYTKNIYNIIGISLTFTGGAIILLSIWIFRLVYRLKTLSSNTLKLVSNEGMIQTQIQLPQATHRDEIGALARSLQSIFSKIKKRNSYLEKISDYLKHEMGNQLNTIRLRIENISDNSKSPAMKDQQKKTSKFLDQLNSTLDTFTNASDIESALVSKDKKNIDLCSALHVWIEDFSDPDTLIHIDSKESEIWVEGASDSLESAIIAILTNARDIRDEGTPIDVKIESIGRKAVIQIKNNGPLIPQENLERIFEMGITMRDQNSNPSSEHMGFGLFLARYIIENHGGDISVINLASKDGVEFSIFLPRVH